MKRFSTLLVCVALLSASTAFSTTPKADQTLGADNGKAMVMDYMATPSTDLFEFTGCDQVYNLDPVTVEKTDIISDGKLYSPTTEIFIHRHYFNPVDYKSYPEYIAGELSDGFPSPVDRPAR